MMAEHIGRCFLRSTLLATIKLGARDMGVPVEDPGGGQVLSGEPESAAVVRIHSHAGVITPAIVGGL